MTDMIWKLGGHEDRELRHYRACGLDDVYLASGYDEFETPEGTGIRVRNLDGLLDAIGRHLATHKKVLDGKELRFLRRHMDLTQAELGKAVGLTSQQVARWEKGQNEISGAAEVLLRVLFLEHCCGNINVTDFVRELEKDDDPTERPIVFDVTPDGWRHLQEAA